MKKTVVIFAMSLLVCVAMFLFNIGKLHSMGYGMNTISGDENVLKDITISTMIGDYYGRHFDILVKDGALSYQYDPYMKDSTSSVYLSADIMMNIDTSGIAFKELENENRESTETDHNGNTIETNVYEGTLERAQLDVSVDGFIKDSDNSDALYIAPQDMYSGLEIISTPNNPLRFEKVVRLGESLANAYPELLWENRSQDSLCFKKGERNYVGMPNLSAQLEGTAHIYDITLTGADSSSFLDAEYKSLLEIPITLGTSGFLYVYKDQYVVVLQRENNAQISKYDASMTLLEQVEIPLLNPQSKFTYYGEKDMLVIQTDSTFTALDINNMEVIDDVTIQDTYVVEDCVYRNNRFYFSTYVRNNNNEIVDPINTNILVYEHDKSVYTGEIHLRDEKQGLVNTSGNIEFRQDKTLFLRDEL